MKHLVLLACLLGAASTTASAQVTGPGFFGINRVTLRGSSDSIVAPAFTRPEAAAGLALSFTGSRVFFKGAPGWAANQFVAGGTVTESCYLLVGSGTKEGGHFITANDGSSVTVDLEGDTLTGLSADHRLAIIPYWTLSTLFPGGAGVHDSPMPGERNTEILFPNFNSAGINASAGRTFYRWSGSWREVGEGSTIRDHEPLPIEAYFIVRHNIATDTEWAGTGQVLDSKLVTYLGVNASGKRDNYLALPRPVAMTLAASGLVASGAFSPSPTPGNRIDELLVFDNTLVRQNKSAAATYYYWSNAWRKVGAGAATFDDTAVFKPGWGFIIRKNAAATAPAWTNSPNY